MPRQFDPGHVYHLFVVRSSARDALQAHLAARGIETLIHYPLSIAEQPAMAATAPASCPEAARACGEVISLPLYPSLDDADGELVAAAVSAFAQGPSECAR